MRFGSSRITTKNVTWCFFGPVAFAQLQKRSCLPYQSKTEGIMCCGGGSILGWSGDIREHIFPHLPVNSMIASESPCPTSTSSIASASLRRQRRQRRFVRSLLMELPNSSCINSQCAALHKVQHRVSYVLLAADSNQWSSSSYGSPYHPMADGKICQHISWIRFGCLSND